MNLQTLFKYCFDVLRDIENITGDKALRNMAYLLNMRLLEPQLCGIGIDDYVYDFSDYDDDYAEKKKLHLLKIVRFSELAKLEPGDIYVGIKDIWNKILSVHPVTKNVFIADKGFDMVHEKTYKKLIHRLAEFNFEEIDTDVLGDVYENVIKNTMTGKTLGQYFTPPHVKKMMVDMIDPKIFPDGHIESIFDPAMGTAGFLITACKYIVKKSVNANICLNWNFILNGGLGGREVESDTFQLAMSNMLICTGKLFKSLEKGDSLKDPIVNKYDIILANPPFGINIKYSEIVTSKHLKYIPVRSGSAAPLFLQAIIHMLKIGGRAAVILPEGKDLFSRNKHSIALREYLMKTCDLREVIRLPSKTFEHTTIRTCILYFYKQKDCSKVLKSTDSSEYKFTKKHQTDSVKFYDYIEDAKNLIVEVDIDRMCRTDYSLNCTEYLRPDIDNNFSYIKDVCVFLEKSKRSASYGKDHGKYPFYSSSQNCTKFCKKSDYKEESIIIGTGGIANIHICDRFSCSKDTYILKSKNEDEVLTRYIYSYLVSNLDILQNGFAGSGLKHITKLYISNIKVPIISIDKQKKVIDCCAQNKEKIEDIRSRIKELEICMDAVVITNRSSIDEIVTNL